MKPEDKANELLNKHYLLLLTEFNSMASIEGRKAYFKKCALICCDEILAQLKNDTSPYESEDINGRLTGVRYWQSVKEATTKL